MAQNYSILLDNQLIASFDNLTMAKLDFDTAKESFSKEDGYTDLNLINENGNVIEYYNF